MSQEQKSETKLLQEIIDLANMLLNKSENDFLKVDDVGQLIETINKSSASNDDSLKSILDYISNNFSLSHAAKEWLDYEKSLSK